MGDRTDTQRPRRVLIVSYCFAPQNIIGAVRPTKLAKYLSRLGHRVTVLCGAGLGGVADPTLERDLRELPDVHVVREWNPLREFKARQRGRESGPGEAPGPPGAGGSPPAPAAPQSAAPRPRTLAKLLDALYLLLARLADRSFARRGWRTVKALEASAGPFDVVLSSYGPHSAHQIAAKAKARGLARWWIADFRDAVEYPFAWQRGAAQAYARRVKERADAITGATEGLLTVMGMLPRAQVITNGFDPEDLPDLPSAPGPQAPESCLTFAYCGQMYRSQADLRPFFRALTELIREGDLDPDRLRLDFAGKPGDWADFAAQAAEYGLEGRARNHGLLPRDRALALQRSAQVLLAAAWNNPKHLGILPGKLLEALLLDRPVVCCITGEVPRSEAARLLAQTRAGYCWERTGGPDSYAGLKAYLRTLCRAFLAGQPLPFDPDPRAVERYAYPRLALRFVALMDPMRTDPRS